MRRREGEGGKRERERVCVCVCGSNDVRKSADLGGRLSHPFRPATQHPCNPNGTTTPSEPPTLSVLVCLLRNASICLSLEPVIRELPISFTVWPRVSVPLIFRPVAYSGIGQDHSHCKESSKDQGVYSMSLI